MTLLLAAVTAAAGAREVYPLDEGWRFYFKEENTSDNARHVTLPHSWNTDPQRQGSWLETTGNYRNDIFIPAGWSSRRLFLKFYGVQSVADLFVNGRMSARTAAVRRPSPSRLPTTCSSGWTMRCWWW